MSILTEAIRALPEDWVTDGTRVSSYVGPFHAPVVIAARPDAPPMVYRQGHGWQTLMPEMGVVS